MHDIATLMNAAPVIPVIVIDDLADAAPLARALVAGGLPVLEVTLRTPVALDAIAAMKRVEGAIVGAGTVVNAHELDQALAAGSEFIVSPGLTEPLARSAIDRGVPFLPGVANAGDIMRGLDLGLTHFKFFPAMAAGGPAALQAIASALRPARNGDLDFIPTGGVTLANLKSWKATGCVAAVGGTWLAKESLVISRAKAGIVAATREALACWNTPA